MGTPRVGNSCSYAKKVPFFPLTRKKCIFFNAISCQEKTKWNKSKVRLAIVSSGLTRISANGSSGAFAISYNLHKFPIHLTRIQMPEVHCCSQKVTVLSSYFRGFQMPHEREQVHALCFCKLLFFLYEVPPSYPRKLFELISMITVLIIFAFA